MKIKTGDLEVIASGIVSSFGMQDVEFHLDEASSMVVVVRVTKELNAESSLELNVENNNRLVAHFVNPHTVMHFGPVSPIFLGSFQGRHLFAMLRLNAMGAELEKDEYGSYTVEYTFFLR